MHPKCLKPLGVSSSLGRLAYVERKNRVKNGQKKFLFFERGYVRFLHSERPDASKIPEVAWFVKWAKSHSLWLAILLARVEDFVKNEFCLVVSLAMI